MGEMAQFKKTTIGKIPEDWKVVRIEDVAETSSGGTPSRDRKEYFGGSIPWVKSGELKDNAIHDTEEKITQKGLQNSSAKSFPKETLLVALYGATVGKVGILGIEATTNQAVCAVLPKQKNSFDPFFLKYYIIFRRNQLISISSGGAQPNISQEIIRSFKIHLPPLPEQKAIAQVLSTVDEAIQKVDEIMAKTERLKKGLMQKLLTKGIGHKEFKDTEIGRIPREWGLGRMKDIVTYKKGVKPKSLSHKEEKDSYPYLTADAIRTGVFTNWAREIDKVVKVDQGDITMIWDGFYCGYVFIGSEGILSSTMIRIEPESNLDKRFLYYLLNTHFEILNTQISGMYLKHVNKFVFESLKIPVPPLSEQQKIASILSTIDKKLEFERKRKERFERIKKGLMNDLLTGRKRVKFRG